jgi:hypothetical protein
MKITYCQILYDLWRKTYEHNKKIGVKAESCYDVDCFEIEEFVLK